MSDTLYGREAAESGEPHVKNDDCPLCEEAAMSMKDGDPLPAPPALLTACSICGGPLPCGHVIEMSPPAPFDLDAYYRGRLAEKDVEIAALKAEIEQRNRERKNFSVEWGPATRERDMLKAALEDLFGLVESGYLVRDISRDGEEGWVMRQLAPTMVLKRAADLVTAARIAREALEKKR